MKLEPACLNCIFFLASTKGHGLCRRYPPKNMQAPEGGIASYMPDTTEDAWCGEYIVNQKWKAQTKAT